MPGSQRPECICKFHASFIVDLKIRSIIDMKFESNKEYMGNLSLQFKDSATLVGSLIPIRMISR